MTKRPSQFNGILIPYDAGIAELKKMIDTSDACRWAAFTAIGCKNTQESLDLLVHYLNSKDAYLRRAALESIGGHAMGKIAAKEILACFEDASAYVVHTACETVKSLGLTEAHNHVVDLLNAPSEESRRTAVNTISAIWLPSDFAAIVSIFKNDRSELVKKEAAWTLIAHAEDDNWLTLFDLLRAESVSRHRMWACMLAEQFGTSDILHHLEAMANDCDGHVLKKALLAIEKVRSAK